MSVPGLSLINDDRAPEDLIQELMAEVALVEEELELHVRSQVELVANVCRHTLRAGGKRLRPAFVAIGAKATGLPFDRARTRRLGACMEMIHMATLIHDDVIDNSSMRRGRPTAGAVFGNRASILSGDALLAKATVLLAKDSDVELIQAVSEAVVEMAEGEVREVEVRGDFELSERQHLEILRLKTASFIEGCCVTGAIVAGANPAVRLALRSYGHHVGMAFQIVDDLLDYRGDKNKTGKPQATDFREGQATLPLIFLREKLSPTERELTEARFGGQASDDEIRMIVDWMDTRESFSRCNALAEEHVERALEAVQTLPDASSRALLSTVADYVIRRQV